MSLTEALNRFTELGAEWILWLLLLLSVISVAVMVERFIVLYKKRGDATALAAKADALLADGQYEELREHLSKSRAVDACVLRAGVEKWRQGPAAAEEAMQGAQVREKLLLERNLAFLGTVGSNAPFIGLAGTVIGVMGAFRNLGQNVQAGAAESVMAAIAEALVATLIGLLVAVPAVVMFNYLQRRVKTVLAHTQVVTHVLLAHLKATPKPEQK